jgi:anti-sigma regulatory factor (Ser/Thr protein kinase)
MDDFNHQPDLRLEMFSQARLLAAVRAMVGSFAQRMGFSDVHSGQVSLAVDEALCNVINHGYEKKTDGRITLSLWAIDGQPARMKVVIEDRARQVDPNHIRSRDLDDIRPGGLGVFIIREIMDEVRYEKREGGGMRLTLVKTVPDSAACCDPTIATATTSNLSRPVPDSQTTSPAPKQIPQRESKR